MSLLLIFSIRDSPCLAEVGLRVCRVWSKSFVFRVMTSIGLIPVCFEISSFRLSGYPAEWIRMSSSSVKGIRMAWS